MPWHPPLLHHPHRRLGGIVDRRLQAADRGDLAQVLAGQRRIPVAGRDDDVLRDRRRRARSLMTRTISALIFGRIAGSSSRASTCLRPPSWAHAGKSAPWMLVLEAV